MESKARVFNAGTGSKAMRTAFIEALTQTAKQDPRIMLLVGDLGFGVVTDFAKRLPEQFVNVGVAEQNMAGVATGLALSGKIPFMASFGVFSHERKKS